MNVHFYLGKYLLFSFFKIFNIYLFFYYFGKYLSLLEFSRRFATSLRGFAAQFCRPNEKKTSGNQDTLDYV